MFRFFRKKPAPKPRKRKAAVKKRAVVKKPKAKRPVVKRQVKRKAAPARKPVTRGGTVGTFFEPRAVMVVGASEGKGTGFASPKFFRAAVENMQRSFRGRTHVVDLSGKLEGAFKDFKKLRGKAELAVLMLPPEAAVKNMKKLIDAQAKAIVVVPRYDGGAREELSASVGRGVRVLGPNAVMGVLNTRNGLRTNFERGVMPRPGGVALVSRSNSVGASVLDWACFHGIGVSKFAFVGEGMDMSEPELLDYLSRDNNTRVICVGVGELREGRKFVEAVRKAAEKKPVLVLKGGIAGERDKIYDAAIRQALAIRVRDVEELLGTADALAKQPPMMGDRVLIISNARGAAVLAADAVYREGLVLAKLSEKTAKAIAQKFPAINVVNPIELGAGAGAKHYGHVLRQVLADPEADGVMVINALKSRLLEPEDVHVVADEVMKPKKPVVDVVMGGEDCMLIRDMLQNTNLPVYDLPDKAARALKALRRYGQIREKVAA